MWSSAFKYDAIAGANNPSANCALASRDHTALSSALSANSAARSMAFRSPTNTPMAKTFNSVASSGLDAAFANLV